MPFPFVNYAHRGASEYMPENTLLSFYMGLSMGANGIETDVQRTKDGVLVLFHDDTLARVTGAEGSVCDYTFHQLQQLWVTKGSHRDKIPSLEDFLRHFAPLDLTFAIELKSAGVEEDTANLLRKYHLEKKAIVTSFHFDFIKNFRRFAPEFQIGYLTKATDDETIARLRSIGGEEICPMAETLTPDLTQKWHGLGLRVRAWGVKNEELMRHVCACGSDGMTVNFPDKLTAFLA